MVKKVNQRHNVINKIKELFNIQGDYKTEEEIVENISIGDKEIELVALKLFVDKVVNNKYFYVNIQNYKICKEESKRLFN
jgi:hypothetical protein